jgi:hypothetical protein
MDSPRLQFSLSEREVKTFRGSLRSLNKVGAELMICATPNEVCDHLFSLFLSKLICNSNIAISPQVTFITISKAQTAHLALTCSADFFDNYAIFGCTLLQAVVPIKVSPSTFIDAFPASLYLIIITLTAECVSSISLTEDRKYHF